MNRLKRAALALAVCGGLFVATPLFAQAPPAQAPKQPAATVGKFIPPVRGTADLEVLTPKTVVKGNQVVTTIEVRNASLAPIAGLKVDEMWWDKNRNPVPGGDTFRSKKPLQPGERLVITLTTQKDANMFQNTYQFSHSYGAVKTKPVKKF